MKLRIALVTAKAARELDTDLEPLVEALRAAGAEVAVPAWDDPAVDWARHDVAVLRSTWDYTDRIDEFVAWCTRCSGRTRLLNPVEVVRWNIDKHYLADLARAGVPVVPTRFVEPQDDAARAFADFLEGGQTTAGTALAALPDEFVVKPAIGAGSRDAARYYRADAAAAAAHVRRLTSAGRSVMLQPYLPRVDHAGETAVLYLGGEYSHAVRKGPLLRAGAPLVEGLFAEEDIRPRSPSSAELDVAAAAYAAIPFDSPVYARIDLLQDEQGKPVLLELELTEPSLFFPQAPGAAERFASHLMRVATATR
jgi:glutathione synthase/RimK-type ligase-like ATP-grasp enzyme